MIKTVELTEQDLLDIVASYLGIAYPEFAGHEGNLQLLFHHEGEQPLSVTATMEI